MKKPAVLGNKPTFKERIPISKPYLPAANCIYKDITKVFSTGMITNAEFVKKLEQKTCQCLGVKNCVAVSSCTSALMLVVRCLDLKGKVIVPSYTFPATILALIWNNIEPVFVDIDPKTYNINPELIEKNMTSGPSAIMATYVYGNPPEIDELEAISKRYNLKLIFDAAHAFGSKYKNKLVGSFGNAEIFSMSPTKLVTAGEGGLITTNNDKLAAKLRIGRNYGDPGTNNCEFLGLNARMPELSAILGLKTIKHIEQNIKRRNIIANLYKTKLLKIPGISMPQIKYNNRCTYKDFSILIEPNEFGLTRDQLMVALDAENITTRTYFYLPAHRQKAFMKYFYKYKDKLPITDFVSNNIISLPIYSDMTNDSVYKICNAIEQIHHFNSLIKKRII